CQTDDHLWTVLRYVERNPLRAGLVKRAEQWRWSSLGQANSPPELRVALSDGPQPRRRDWIDWVNRPQTPAEEADMVRCIRQDRPYADHRKNKRDSSRFI